MAAQRMQQQQQEQFEHPVGIRVCIHFKYHFLIQYRIFRIL
jgi:hypothetical protein